MDTRSRETHAATHCYLADVGRPRGARHATGSAAGRPRWSAALVDVAAQEDFHVPLSKDKEVVSDGNNSLRAALDWLGTPQSMAYLTPAAEAAA